MWSYSNFTVHQYLGDQKWYEQNMYCARGNREMNKQFR
jgi:hypothetical protein